MIVPDTAQVLNTAIPASPTVNSINSITRRTGGLLITKTNTCNGDGAQTDNIFTVTGSVEILDIWAVCTEATNATDLAACSLAIYDGTATLELTDSGAPTDCSGINVGDLLFKNGASATVALVRQNNDAAVLTDVTETKVRVTKKLNTATYIQFLFNGDVNTDVDIKFYVSYVPKSDDGLIVAS
ncbi:hypothetical protein M0R04_12280 [Candidatus Dojkabacteria bacterium]|jgi:hypothetical protein|nr:hypothetical protein [Candidatus Dojkabacteria bacterium]